MIATPIVCIYAGPIWFRLSVYPTCVLKSMGYTRSRNHFASTMHDDVNLRHQDPHSVYPMHGVMVHNESTPSFVVVTMAIPTLTPIAPQCGDVSGLVVVVVVAIVVVV